MKKEKKELKYFKKFIILGIIISLALTTISTNGMAEGAFIRGIITSFGYDPDTGGSLTIENHITGQSATILLAPHSLLQQSVNLIQAAMDNHWLVEAEYDPCTYYLMNLYIYPFIVPPGFLLPINKQITPC